MQKLFI